MGGLLAGTAGIDILSSDDAKKLYTSVTAAALRGHSRIMEKVTLLRENCNDIYADALRINEDRAANKAAQVVEDASDEGEA